MRMEAAIVRLVNAARDRNTPPDRLASLLELGIKKLVETNPNGPKALKIVQTQMLKELVKNELKVSMRLREPKKGRELLA